MDLSSWIENDSVKAVKEERLHDKAHPLFLDGQSIAESLESSHETRKLAKPKKLGNAKEDQQKFVASTLEYGDDGSQKNIYVEPRRPMTRRCSTGGVRRTRERRQSGAAVSSIQSNSDLQGDRPVVERNDSIKVLKDYFITSDGSDDYCHDGWRMQTLKEETVPDKHQGSHEVKNHNGPSSQAKTPQW